MLSLTLWMSGARTTSMPLDSCTVSVLVQRSIDTISTATATSSAAYTATVEAVDRRPSATWVDVRWEEVEPGSGAGRERLQADSLAEDHIALTAQEVRPPAPPSPRAVQNEYEESSMAKSRKCP